MSKIDFPLLWTGGKNNRKALQDRISSTWNVKFPESKGRLELPYFHENICTNSGIASCSVANHTY